jgi:hypothetical protein
MLSDAIDSYKTFLDNWPMVFSIPMTIILLRFHFFVVRRRQHGVWPVLLAMLGFLIALFSTFPSAPSIHLFEFWAATLNYSCMLFVLISEIFLHAGVAERLTKWRGEKWVKELDYVYLFIGALGLTYSVDRLEIVNQKVVVAQWIGPFLIATALVVRTIKTRADIGSWNKLPNAK